MKKSCASVAGDSVAGRGCWGEFQVKAQLIQHSPRDRDRSPKESAPEGAAVGTENIYPERVDGVGKKKPKSIFIAKFYVTSAILHQPSRIRITENVHDVATLSENRTAQP